MDANQEINDWLIRHRQLESEAAKDQFYQELLESLGNRDSDILHEGLLALKESVRSRRIKAEKAAMTNLATSFQVFPNNLEEQELLQNLLERMKIPYKKSA